MIRGRNGTGRHKRPTSAPTAAATQAQQAPSAAVTRQAPAAAAVTPSVSPAHTDSFAPTRFAEATDISDLAAERRRLQRNLIVMRVITILLLVAALAVACFPLALQFQSSMELAKTAATSAQNVANWPYPQAEDALKAARAYNEKLAQSGQPILGEAVDPFSGAQGGSQASGEDSASSKDKEYQSLLNAGDEVMGTIKVPKQSIDLPIYHGTSEEALASGAGHLYGSSLPVGGKSTHSVITGHRGLVEAMMFTRLDEMKKGDFFYIEVMGQTLGYEVDRISVILPNDTSQLKIVPGEDRVTLMTCTPYGVNTHRLLVSGHRVAIPIPAPKPNDVHDARNIAIAVGLGVLLLGWLVVLFARRHQSALIMRHAAWWPWRKRRGDRPNDTIGSFGE
ncbi:MULTISPECIES: class C sortase [unclassified Bifidobacterium]|uniref:class C sortase n=1 Tax=unclassified Bifidobacterium TaxID=2608897 RepID=UPI0011295D7A|nr:MULTISPECIES: class C sortase [unclassified Bifidobacterium]TPF78420.1 sortase [Bifidobacterium sp. UTCIF-1]TPF79504.1 sortase [Bifidobacterium sp. UTCIF-24]TPF82173.1 sortase [Bifidobacterium sp. UTCIF-3]TPF84804.1 sortase [Bifidobacterium sp. UTCIF-36]TPF88597.1 sortase [Bifidobacterium sp. UTBIF-56]